jgi:hypothetical protein
MKSKDSKIQISLKILVKIIEDKIQAKNVTVLSAGIFNPYLKKGILQKHGEFVENHILAQLRSASMTEFHDEFSSNAFVDNLIQNENLVEEEEGFGANKKLKFDEDMDINQERIVDETAENEFKRYKTTRLSKADVLVLFNGKVTYFNSRPQIYA